MNPSRPTHRRALHFAALLFGTLAALPALGGGLRNPAVAAPTCSANMRLCSGRFGAQCYSPSSGQSCLGGLVCGSSQQVCQGAFGATCYTPSSGQQCQQGVVCQAGQSICSAGGFPHCYSPASGEHCQ